MSNNYEDLISSYRELSEEERNKFLKELILGEIFKDNIEAASNDFKPPWFLSLKLEERRNNYLKILEQKSNESVDHLLALLGSEDTVLKYTIFRHFASNFDYYVDKTKKDICGKCHDYGEWEEVEGERPVVRNKVITEERTYGKYLVRKCKYCGTLENAYSEEHKAYLEKESVERIKAKKLFYFPIASDNQKNSQ